MAKRILVADDSSTIQKAFAMVFGGQDISVVAARSVDEAVSAARHGRPDLIIADVTLGNGNGYDLCATLKADPQLRAVPVMILASTHVPYDETRGHRVGAIGSMLKPFDSQAVLDQVNAILARGEGRPAAVAAPAPAPAPPARESADRVETASGEDEDDYGEFTIERPVGGSGAAPMPARPAPAPPARPAPAPPPAAPAGLRPSLIPGVRPGAQLPPRAAPPPAAAAAAAVQRQAMGRTMMGLPAMAPPAPAPLPARPAPVAAPVPRPAAPLTSPLGSPRQAMPVPAPAPAPAPRPAAPAPAPAPSRPVAPVAAPAPAPRPAPAPSPLPAAAAVSGAVAQKVAAMAARGPEYEAIAKLSREVIEQIVWEVVPELAEVIIRQEVDRLAAAKRG